MQEFSWPVRVYYEDTDSGGVVYYANYLRFMERARTERLRQMGFEQDRLRRDPGILFTVHSIQVDYKRPAVFNDELAVSARISELKRASLVFHQQVTRIADAGTVLCEGQIRIACVDAGTFKSRPIPVEIRDIIIRRTDRQTEA